jgi:hypothetical protein
MPENVAADPEQRTRGKSQADRSSSPTPAGCASDHRPRSATGSAADVPNLELTNGPDDRCPPQTSRRYVGRQISAAIGGGRWTGGYWRRAVRASWRCSRSPSWART